MSHLSTVSQSSSNGHTSVRSQRYADPRLALARIVQSRRFRRGPTLQLCPEPHAYIPRMDLYDDEDQPHFAAMLELPGVDWCNLLLHVENGKLIVHGERDSPFSARPLTTGSAVSGMFKQNTFIPQYFKIRELKFGSFHREIDIPDGVKAKHINAELYNGMLLIIWPRKLDGTDMSTIETS